MFSRCITVKVKMKTHTHKKTSYLHNFNLKVPLFVSNRFSLISQMLLLLFNGYFFYYISFMWKNFTRPQSVSLRSQRVLISIESMSSLLFVYCLNIVAKTWSFYEYVAHCTNNSCVQGGHVTFFEIARVPINRLSSLFFSP